MLGELARRQSLVLAQAEQEPILGVAEPVGPVRVPALEPSDRLDGGLERMPQLLVGRKRLCLRGSRAHAATASASVSASTSVPACARAARSARSSTMQGTIASAVSPADAQNAIP